MKYLFEEIIQIKTVHLKLNEMDLANQEKEELLEIMKSTVHHKVIDLILSELTDEEKEIFLEGISTGGGFSDMDEQSSRSSELKNRQYLSVLRDRINNLETKIKEKVKEAEEELILLLADQTSR